MVFDLSNNSSNTLQNYLEFDSSHIPDSVNIPDLEPINLEQINLNILNEMNEGMFNDNESSSITPSITSSITPSITPSEYSPEISPIQTLNEEVKMYSIEPPQLKTCDTVLENPVNMLAHQNKVIGNSLEITTLPENEVNIEVARKIQSGGGNSINQNNNLSRKNLVKIVGKDEQYIVCQIKDIFYDSESETILRNYGIRKINQDGKVLGTITEITSNDIVEVSTIGDLNLQKEDIQYDNDVHKDEDIKVNQDYEEVDPTAEEGDDNEEDDNEEGDPDIEDLNVMVDINSRPNENNIDEENFEFEEFNDTIVLEVIQELEESKILFTENEQEEDIIEELIRLLPPKKRNDKNELKKIINKVRVLKYLKNKYSKSSLSTELTTEEEFNEMKQNILIKGRNYKPVIQKYLKNDYSDEILLPSISVDNKKYEELTDNKRKNILNKKVTGDDVDYLSELDRLNDIYKRYKEDSDLDYDNKIKNIDNLFKPSTPKIDKSFYNTNVKRDTKTIENFSDTKKIITSTQLGQDSWTDEYGKKHISSNGYAININGFIVNKNNKNPHYIIEKTELSGYKQNNLNYWEIKKEDIDVNYIDNDSIYQKGDKVRVCIKEDKESIDVVGTIKGSKRNFIYVQPDDKKLIDSDTQILEFDADSKNIIIDKMNEVKNSMAFCFNKKKNNVYLLNGKEVLDKKNIKNILNQIVPSIYQIFRNENLKSITFNDQVDRILSNYGLGFNDLEINNYSHIKSLLTKNISTIKRKYNKKTEQINNVKRTYDKIISQEYEKYKKRDFDFINNNLVSEINKIYDEYLFRELSFDNDDVRTAWIMNQDDFGKAFAFTLINNQIKSHKLEEKIGVLQSHKIELENESRQINDKLEDEIRKNEFFTNPDNICKEGIVSKITKIYLTINKLDDDNFRDILVDPQFKTILEDESVKIGSFCILKDSNNPSISPENVDLNDRIFERILGEDKRPLWKEKSKGFLTDYIREYKKICQAKGQECKFTNSFGPCEPVVIKRLKENKKENKLKLEQITKKIIDIREKRREKEIDNKYKYYIGRGLLDKKNREQQKKIKEDNNDKFRKSIPLEIDRTELKDFNELEKMRENLKNPEKREAILKELKAKYDIDFIDFQTPDDSVEQTQDGNFNEAGQRVVYTEVIGGRETLQLTDNEIVDSVRSFLMNTIEKENPMIEEELDIVKNIIKVFLKILGVDIETRDIELKVLNIYGSNIISFKKFKSSKKDIKEKEAKSKYSEFKIENLIYYTTTILLVELQIKLNNYFMSHYEKCVSSIDGYPVITKSDESEVGDRFNYGINFFTCILDNLKKGDGYWKSIKKKKKDKISSNFKTILDVIANEREFESRLSKKRTQIKTYRDQMDQIEQSYLWNEFRPYLNKIGDIKEPPDIDLNDCNIGTNRELVKVIRLAEERNKWYSQKIFEKINSIIQNENVENIKYDPLPIGNTCCLDLINGEYDYYNFLYDKDKSNQLKDLIQKSKEIEERCSIKDFKLFYVKPTTVRPKLESFYLEIFPEKSKLNDKLITKMFKSFVPHGINQGKKRIFESLFTEIDNSSKVKIDILTNSYLSELEKEYTTEEYYNLLEIVHSNNKIEEIIEEPIEKDIYKFKVQKVINDIRDCLNNEYFLNNKFLKDLLEKDLDILSSGKVSDISRIWDKLKLEIKDSTENLMKNFKTLKTTDKNKLENIIQNIDDFELTEKSDEIIFEGNDIKKNIEKLKRKENAFKDYFFNYLKRYISMLSNNKKIAQ